MRLEALGYSVLADCELWTIGINFYALYIIQKKNLGNH